MKTFSPDRSTPDQGKSSHPLVPLVIILGPTASGKTAASIELAERFSGEIISADSRLFYRGMNIGTAKPTKAEQSRARHHLIDVADPDETWSLGVFINEAQKAISEVISRHHLPIMVGGTGQFIRSVIEGWTVPKVEPNPRLRAIISQWGKTIGLFELHEKLSILDPQAALSIDPSNERRTVRALEVIFSTGKRFSEQRTHGSILYNPLLLGLSCPRVELYKRIDERIDGMIEQGFIDEVKGLLNAGYSDALPTLTAIGYGEICAYIKGAISLEEAIRLIRRRTRIYVRRQANWFKESDPQIHWFQTGPKAVDEMGEILQQWLTQIQWNSGVQS